MTDPVPSNSLNPNEFVSIFADLLKADTAKNSGVAKLRAIRGRFEKLGCNMRALDLMLKLRRMEPDEAQMLLRDALRYSAWVHMKIGEQSDLFASDDAPRPNEQARGELAEAEAYNEGHEAGMKGRSSTSSRFAAGTPVHQRWRQGWDDGQDEIAKTFLIERPEDGRPISAPKKEKAKAPGTTLAAGAKPRGRGRPRRDAGASA